MSRTPPDAEVVVGVVAAEVAADPALAPMLEVLRSRAVRAGCAVDERDPGWIVVCGPRGDDRAPVGAVRAALMPLRAASVIVAARGDALGALDGVPAPALLVGRAWLGGMVVVEAELRYDGEADAALAEREIRSRITAFLSRPGASLLGTVGASREAATVHLRATLTRLAAGSLVPAVAGMGAGKASGGAAAVR